jgi:peptidoglycan hydrolase CwlO-like protein
MERPLKPKILGDIIPGSYKRKRWNVFTGLNNRINLAAKRSAVDFPLKKYAQSAIVVVAAAFLIFGSASAPTILTRASGDSSTSTAALSTADEQTQLQNQLKDLESQINQYEGQITSYKQQGSTLNGQIADLNAKVAKLNLQIEATNLTLTQLDQQIGQTQSQIVETQADIQNKKIALGSLLQGLYETDNVTLVETFLKNPRLSDFWSNTQDLALMQDNTRIAVQQVADLQTQLQGQEQQFEASKTDAASIQAYQQAQASQIASTKSAKAQLLTETKGQESKYQTLLQQTQATAAQIRNRIFQLLGGGQLSFEDAYQYAKLASNATGVDPSLILAVLDRESALGQNVGQCTYKTAMSPSNIPIFLQITSQLGLDPNTMMVSCANADGAYGGAMGPAQFEPSTWELYVSGITSVTGDNPPSPWKNADAFAATALYLKDAQTGCLPLYSSSISQERCTAAKYYAGSRWKNYLWTYGEAVVDRAQSFANDIQTINGA